MGFHLASTGQPSGHYCGPRHVLADRSLCHSQERSQRERNRELVRRVALWSPSVSSMYVNLATATNVCSLKVILTDGLHDAPAIVAMS